MQYNYWAENKCAGSEREKSEAMESFDCGCCLKWPPIERMAKNYALAPSISFKSENSLLRWPISASSAQEVQAKCFKEVKVHQPVAQSKQQQTTHFVRPPTSQISSIWSKEKMQAQLLRH